jgi:hypothetical protein
VTDKPYTDDDLRAEAARQHYVATIDPDFMGIGEQVDGRFINSSVDDPDPGQGTEPVTGRTWDSLNPEEFGKAQRAIDDLLGKAADVSDWAINLGADGLEPVEHCLSIGADDRPIARVHFAFEPGMPEKMRQSLVMGIATEIAKHLPEGATP